MGETLKNTYTNKHIYTHRQTQTHKKTDRQTQTHRQTNIQVKRDKVLHFFVLSTLALTVNEGMCIHPT